MTFTLQANRRTTASRRPMRLSAVISMGLLCSVWCMAQDPVRSPVPMPQENKPAPLQQPNQVATEEEGRYTPPGKDDLFRVDSEASLAERARQRRKLMGQTELEFPDSTDMRITSSLEKRKFIEMTATKQPSYVVFQPLYFQQINHERYGWELGVFQPIVSTGQFYGDVLLFPYKFAANPPWCCETNAGYALPGDPEPLRFLTTPFSWRGVIGQTGAAVGGAAIFP